jgi:hypothetical protein
MEKEHKPLPEEKKGIANLARYSAMGFQMFAIMGLAAWGGIALDRHLNWKFPVFTFLLTIAGVVLALVYFIRDIGQFSRKK